MINFNNLIVGRHESRVLFMWNPKEEVAMLGAFIGIKDGIEAILARDGITPAQRVILEEFRAIAAENSWDFATLRESLLGSQRQETLGGYGERCLIRTWRAEATELPELTYGDLMSEQPPS